MLRYLWCRHPFSIRYRAGINAGMRVVHNLTAYEILAVQPDVGGREYVDLVCQVVN